MKTSLFHQTTVLENATVYSERINQYHTRYYGKDADLVTKRAQLAVEAIDNYRSPHKSTTYRTPDGYFNADVEWYGLD